MIDKSKILRQVSLFDDISDKEYLKKELKKLRQKEVEKIEQKALEKWTEKYLEERKSMDDSAFEHKQFCTEEQAKAFMEGIDYDEYDF